MRNMYGSRMKRRFSALMSSLSVFVIAWLVTACGTLPVGSVGGECQVVHTPKYVVLGKTQYDQNWIDETTERLVGACNHPRPEARPEGFDAKPAKAIPPKKKKFWQRKTS